MLQLPSQVTATEARDLLARFSLALPADVNGQLVTVDASAVAQLDSSCIALLLALRRRVQAGGGSFGLTGAGAPLLALVRAYGLDGLLSPDAESAPL